MCCSKRVVGYPINRAIAVYFSDINNWFTVLALVMLGYGRPTRGVKIGRPHTRQRSESFLASSREWAPPEAYPFDSSFPTTTRAPPSATTRAPPGRGARAPQRRSGGRPASSSSHGVDPAAERPDRGATTADRAGTSELLTSALESGTGELLTSPHRPWRPVLRSSARACSHVWL
jgi:hypothetical protein